MRNPGVELEKCSDQALSKMAQECKAFLSVFIASCCFLVFTSYRATNSTPRLRPFFPLVLTITLTMAAAGSSHSSRFIREIEAERVRRQLTN